MSRAKLLIEMNGLAALSVNITGVSVYAAASGGSALSMPRAITAKTTYYVDVPTDGTTARPLVSLKAGGVELSPATAGVAINRPGIWRVTPNVAAPALGVDVAPVAANITGAATVDLSLGLSQELTLTGNVTSWAMSNPPDQGSIVTLQFVQDATGSRTIASADSKIKLAGTLTLTTTATKRDILRFLVTGTDGTMREISRSMNV